MFHVLNDGPLQGTNTSEGKVDISNMYFICGSFCTYFFRQKAL